MARLLSFIALIFFATPLLSTAKDKIEKGFDCLTVYDYFKAREYFYDAVKKQPAEAYYGLSIISSRSDNPFFNIDSARVFILKADSAFKVYPTKDIASIEKNYHITYADIVSRKDTVATIAFNKARDKKTVEDWNYFIDKYNYSSLKASAVAKRNNLAFSKAKKENSSEAYKDFLDKYPDALEAIEAKKYYDETLFKELTEDQSEAAYASFIDSFPENPHRAQAEDSLFVISTKEKSPDSYYAFVKKYPANKNVETAWMKLYNRYLEINGSASMNRFLVTYPEFPFREHVLEEYKFLNVQMLPYRQEDKWGFITDEGNVAIEAQFDEVNNFSEGLAAVSKKDKYGFINKAGKQVIDFRFDEADAFDSTSGMAIVTLNGKASLINRDGEASFPPKFEDIGGYPQNERILFLNNGKYGYCNLQGEEVIPARFPLAYDFSNGIAVAGKSGQLGVIDTSGKWLVQPDYEFIVMLPNGLLKAEQNKKFGLLNHTGEVVLPVTYDAIGDFSEGLAFIVKGNKGGYINVKADIAIPITFDFDNPPPYEENRFKNGYAKIKIKGKYGLIDTSGDKIIPATYENIRFNGNSSLIAVRKNGKWGYINLENKIKIPFKYNNALEWSEDYGRVRIKNQYGVIDGTGKLTVPFLYENILPFKNDIALVKKGNRYGLITSENKALIPSEFEKYQWENNDILRMENENKFGYYSVRKKDWIWRENGLSPQ